MILCAVSGGVGIDQLVVICTYVFVVAALTNHSINQLIGILLDRLRQRFSVVYEVEWVLIS